MLFLCQFVLGSQLFEERSGIPVYINKKGKKLYKLYTKPYTESQRVKERERQRDKETKSQRDGEAEGRRDEETKRGREYLSPEGYTPSKVRQNG